jgi:NAD(P)H dehydrogenase (quinone)
MPRTIVVTGASGHLGRGVVAHLLRSNRVDPSDIIATTRTPAAVADLAAHGVIVRRADFNDPPSLEPAFAGGDTVLIVSTDELDPFGGKRLKQHQAAVVAAKHAGATHVAYTSMLRPEPGSPFLIASDHYGTEQAMKASGLAYTIFRPNAYHENLLTSLPRIIETGRWLTSAGDGRVAYAARDDIAAAIAGRLASDSTETAEFELTGPKAYSNAEVAELVSGITGRSLQVLPVSDDALNEALQTAGVPEAYARLWVSAEVNVRAGNSELVTDTIEKLSRRQPTPLTQFLETHRSALRP